jgi:hypothetical protein
MAAMSSSPRFGETSVGSLILGYIVTMGTILVVLMVLLNSYLEPAAPSTAHQPPLPAIGQVAASVHQAGQLPAASPAGSPANEASRTPAANAAAGEGTANPPAPFSDAQAPVTADAAPTIAEHAETPTAAAADSARIKPQKSANRRKVHRQYDRPYGWALGYNGEAAYRQSYGPFSRGGARF